MTGLALPRVLYVGDIQIENSHHSSAQLSRLLGSYPPHLLKVIETWTPSRAERRLPQVEYLFDPIAPGVARVGRGPAFAWHVAAANRYELRHRAAIEALDPQAVLTIGYGFGWLAAARLARRLGVPLLFVAHDEWPKLRGTHPLLTSWLRRQFASAYCQAHGRLCVSPSMVETLQRRYGCGATVLYPVGADDGPVNALATPRALAGGDRIVIGFGGASGQEVMQALRDLARAIDRVNGTVVAYGPFDEAQRRDLLSISSSIEFPGFVDSREMIAQLRDRADVLFVPMSFDSAAGDYATLSFPSKLADYTRTGVPILVYGPPQCSAVQWARAHDDAAEILTTSGADALTAALDRMKHDAAHRHRLAQGAAETAEMFLPSRGRATLYTALASATAPRARQA